MAKTIRLATLLVAVLCLVPGCDDAEAGDGSCDPIDELGAATRCLGTSTIQVCEAQPDGSGAWEYYDECGGNLSCTMIDACDLWRNISQPLVLAGDSPCPAEYRQDEWTGADCVYVDPGGAAGADALPDS